MGRFILNAGDNVKIVTDRRIRNVRIESIRFEAFIESDTRCDWKTIVRYSYLDESGKYRIAEEKFSNDFINRMNEAAKSAVHGDAYTRARDDDYAEF